MAQLILMALHYTLHLLPKLGAPSVPLGEARRIRSATKVFLRIFVYSLRFAFARIAVPIALV
jgi:hypothetical protein